MKGIYNELDTISKLIDSNEPKIFSQKADDKYLKPLPNQLHKFELFDFVDLKVKQLSTGKELKLKTYLMYPDDKLFPIPNGIIFMFHGLGAYTCNNAHVAKCYAGVGLLVVGYDYRGHGLSEGYNGNFESLNEVISDLKYSFN